MTGKRPTTLSDPDEDRIRELEAEGLTRSDAQSAAEAELIEPKVRPSRKARQESKAAIRAACLCGCGGIPKGKKARYLPGHDARHHAALKAAGKKVTLISRR